MNRSPFVSMIFFLSCIFVSLAWGHPGWGIVINSKGEIFFSDVNRNIIWRIDKTGTTTACVRGKHSHDLFIDRLDNLYGVHVEYDQPNDRWIYQRLTASPDGVVRVLKATEGTAYLTVHDDNGNEYLNASHAHKREARILKVTPAGDTVVVAGGVWGDRDGTGAAAQFRTFGPLVWGPDSALYAGSGGMVRRVTLGGVVTTVIGKQHGFGDPDRPNASGILGLCFDEKQNLFAASWEKNVVVKVSADGRVISVLKSGPFWSPSGVFAFGNDLYVLEHRNGITIPLENAGFGGPRIRKISADGKVTIVGTAP